MQIDVNDILRGGEGTSRRYELSETEPQLDDLELVPPLTAELTLVGTKTGVVAYGTIAATVSLECHRCLHRFTHELTTKLSAEYEDHPEEDQYPIDRFGRIDLAEPIRQELIVSLPLQQLCQEDCDRLPLSKENKENHGRSQKTHQ